MSSRYFVKERVVPVVRKRLQLNGDISYYYSPYSEGDGGDEYGDDVTEIIGFHAASEETVWKIWKTGFDSSKILDRPLGKWIFCASDPLIAHTYSKASIRFSRRKWTEHRFMVVCKVRLVPELFRLSGCTGGTFMIAPDQDLIHPLAVIQYSPTPCTRKLRLNSSKAELECDRAKLLARLKEYLIILHSSTPIDEVLV